MRFVADESVDKQIVEIASYNRGAPDNVVLQIAFECNAIPITSADVPGEKNA